MEFEAIVNLLTNTGVTIVVLGYFLIRDYKFMHSLSDTLTTLVNTVDALKEFVKGDN